MDVSARCLTGLTENDKINQLIDVRTLLQHIAYTTNPVTLEDNESKRKEEVLAVAVFDKQVYVAQNKSFKVLCSAIMATNQVFKYVILS